MAAAIASKSWREAVIVCGDGLRVPRSASNASNHAGSSAFGSEPPDGERAANTDQYFTDNGNYA